jgi:hypothetical protein
MLLSLFSFSTRLTSTAYFFKIYIIANFFLNVLYASFLNVCYTRLLYKITKCFLHVRSARLSY